MSRVSLELSPVQKNMVQAISEINMGNLAGHTLQIKEHPSCRTHVYVGLKEGWSMPVEK